MSEQGRSSSSGPRQAWGFTRLSETDERCNVCGSITPRNASAMKAHRDLHAFEEATATANSAPAQDHDRIAQRDGRGDLDAILIAALQEEGTLELDHAAYLEEALHSSRTIGTAIGVVMATRNVSDVDAFQLLRRLGTNTDRTLRDVADEIVRTGDVSSVPGR